MKNIFSLLVLALFIFHPIKTKKVIHNNKNYVLLNERQLIIQKSPKNILKRSHEFIEPIINVAHVLDIDPVVIYSVAWTETHFRIRNSYMGAKGLMQLMPATEKELRNKHKATINHIKTLYPMDELFIGKDKYENIILGSLYLKKLLKMFKNKKYAIIAYNMGPNWVKRRLRKRLPVGNTH